MKKIIGIFIVVLLFDVGCGQQKEKKTETKVDNINQAITIKHAEGETKLDKPAKKVVVLEWRYSEDLLALGVQPVWMADIKNYNKMKQLDVLVLGDDLATGLGQPANKTRLALIVLATLLTSINIAAVGTVAFLGLVAPHLARIVVGMNYQRRFVCSALFGATLLSIADLLGRTIAYPKEIPSGLVVAVLGAPYFLWLMRRSGKKVN